jgi:hypothetical protein
MKFSITFLDGWLEKLNDEFNLIAQAVPYAKIVLTFRKEEGISAQSDFDHTVQFFKVANQTVYFILMRNRWFNRKLVDQDAGYLNKKRLAACFSSAIHRLGPIWASRATKKRSEDAKQHAN